MAARCPGIPCLFGLVKHVGVGDEYKSENLVRGATDGQLMDQVFIRIAPIEPSIGTYLARCWIIGGFAVKDSERETVGVKLIPRKPPRGYVWAA